MPSNPRDAHRPLLPHDDLRRAFSWQEQRRLTNNLTLHYKRVLYVVDSTSASEKARGKRVDIREDEDGTVHIEYQGAELSARAFAKDAHINPAAIVENKALSHTLRVIQAAQLERDAQRLETKRLTLRDKELLRKAMGDTVEIHAHRKRPRRTPFFAPMPLTTSVADPDPLGRVLAWAKTQAPPQAQR